MATFAVGDLARSCDSVLIEPDRLFWRLRSARARVDRRRPLMAMMLFARRSFGSRTSTSWALTIASPYWPAS